MKTKTGSRILKILCIGAVLMLMLALCGCRTRITNNNEVSNVTYDDGGYMQDEYDMRREELDLSTAKKPVFTGFGSTEDDEEEYDYGDDSQTLEDYEPSEEEEVDDSNPPEANSSGTNTSGSNSNVNRRVVQKTTTTVITVTLNPNGGKCKTKSISVRNGGKYGVLPTPTKEGYTFSGWYTKKDDGKGSKVTSSTKVTAKTNHTLYAHWKEGGEKTEEPTDEDKIYTVIYTDGVDNETVFEDKKTENLKKDDSTPGFGEDPARDGYSFAGWSPAPTEKIDTASADSNNIITYKAQWKSNNDIWSETLKATQKTKKKVSFEGPDSDNDFVKSCNGDKSTDNPTKIGVVVTNDFDDADAVSGAEKTLVISKKAINSDNENEKLYLKLLIVAAIYDLDVSDARGELKIDTPDDELIKVIEGSEGEPIDVTPDEPTDVTPDEPTDVTPDTPAETSQDTPADTSQDTPADTSQDTPADSPDGAPADGETP